MLAQRMPHGARLGPRFEPHRPRPTTGQREAYLPIRASTGTQQKTDGKKVELGRSGVVVDDLGDRSFWGYEGFGSFGEEQLRAAYRALVDNNLTFIDTAEMYGFGTSERLLADFMKTTGTRPAIATKFPPLPWRFTADQLVKACKGSLGRLQLDSVDLYMIHWPAAFINGPANNAFIEGLARVHQAKLASAVGVSNFKEERDRGVPLASNQVQYSLLYRAPERNGVMQACQELGITLVAYSPLTQGLLSGKYTQQNKPTGPRALIFDNDKIARIQPLLSLMRDIGEGHGGKTPAQVALNWVICKGALPIIGVKSAEQAEQAAGARGWRLTDDEVARLDRTSSALQNESLGAPFEKW